MKCYRIDTGGQMPRYCLTMEEIKWAAASRGLTVIEEISMDVSPAAIVALFDQGIPLPTRVVARWAADPRTGALTPFPIDQRPSQTEPVAEACS